MPTRWNKRRARAMAARKPTKPARAPDDREREAERQHAELVKRQRAYLSAIAAKIVNGEPLNKHERGTAFAAIEFTAKQISLVPRKSAGRPKKVDPFAAARMVESRIADGMKKARALAAVAELYGVSDQAIVQAIAPHLSFAKRATRN